MARLYAFAIFCLVFGFVCIAGPQTALAQDKPIPEAKEKAECEDDDEDEDITEADRASIKVTMADARRIALSRVAGKITDAELEKENGRLQYAFDICTADGKCFDVEIDAITGEVLQAEEEDDDDDDGPVTKTVVKKKIVDQKAVVAKKPQ